MSLKNDIEMVKEELNSEEKFFEKAVITEKFIKKYKNIMIGSLAVIVIGVGSNIAYNMNLKSNIESANKSLAILQKDSTNTQELLNLKKHSPNLHDLFLYSKAMADKDIATLEKLKNSKAPILNDLVKYELAQDSNNVNSLNEYTLKQDAIYKDLAQIQSAVILMNNGKIDDAHEKLSLVNQQSSLGKVAQLLLHYGVK